MKWFSILSLILCSSVNAIAQVIESPKFDYADQPSLHIEKVNITSDTTFVYCTYSAEPNSWANISGDTYLKGYPSNKKYKLLSCSGLPIGPQKRIFTYGEKCEITFRFPSVEGSIRFDFIEDSDDKVFNIYGVNLLECFDKSYEEREYKRFQSMSEFYRSANDNVKYLDLKDKELDAACYLFGTKSMEASLCYQQLSLFYSEIGDYTKAIQLGLQELVCDSIHFGVNNKDYPLYAIALSNIASNYSRVRNESLAIEYQKKAIANRKDLADSGNYLFELEMMVIGGDSIARINIVENELSHLPEYVDTTSVAFANVLKALTVSYEIMDDYNRALSYCDRSLSVLKWNVNENILRIAEVQGRMCRYKRRLGFYTEAIALGEKAKNTFDSLQVRPNVYGTILEDLAWCYGEFFNYEKAIYFQEQNIEFYREKQDWISMAGVYNSIGNYFQRAEDLVNAEVYINKGIDLLDSHDDAREYIMAEVERTGNNYIDNPFALESIKQHIFYVKTSLLQELARIHEKEGKMSDAITKEKELGELLLSMGQEQSYAIHLLTLSGYYLKDKQYEKAIECVEKSLQLFDKENNPDVAMHYYFLSLVYMEKDDIEKAIQYAEKSVSNTKNYNNQEVRFGVQPILSNLYWKKGDFKNAEHNMSEVLYLLRDTISNDIAGMTTEQKQRMWDKFEPYFQFYRNILEKSERNDTLLSKLYNYTLFSKSLLLDSEIRKDDKDPSRLLINWKDVQQKLSDCDIAIEFISTGSDSIYHTYHALIIDRTCKSPNMITLYNESDLELIRKTSTQSIIDIVGNLIWKPILDQYKDINSIYFSLDGIINILPIEYSNVDGVGEMMDRYNMYRLSSTKEIVFHNQKEIKKNAVLYGGLDYDFQSNNSDEKRYSLWRSINARGGFEPLASTYKEIQDIANLLKSQNVETNLYFGKQGTEDSFKNLSGKEVSMIHLSTHGMYVSPNNVSQKKKENNFDFLETINNERDPVKEDIVLTHSFLVMSGGNKLAHHETIEPGMNDGILTAFEISQLDLSKLDLVVLSACETGLGDLDNGGVYGLQRGFKKAGANTILMSLDKVDDEATKILMVEFYKNLMNGKSKHQSLKDAQKHLRQVDNGKYDDPKYWASFIMLDGLN